MDYDHLLDNLKTIKLSYPSEDLRNNLQTIRSTDTITWLTLIEQTLSDNFKNYTVTVYHDIYDQIYDVYVEFASEEDAMLFKLRYTK